MTWTNSVNKMDKFTECESLNGRKGKDKFEICFGRNICSTSSLSNSKSANFWGNHIYQIWTKVTHISLLFKNSHSELEGRVLGTSQSQAGSARKGVWRHPRRRNMETSSSTISKWRSSGLFDFSPLCVFKCVLKWKSSGQSKVKS